MVCSRGDECGKHCLDVGLKQFRDKLQVSSSALRELPCHPSGLRGKHRILARARSQPVGVGLDLGRVCQAGLNIQRAFPAVHQTTTLFGTARQQAYPPWLHLLDDRHDPARLFLWNNSYRYSRPRIAKLKHLTRRSQTIQYGMDQSVSAMAILVAQRWICIRK